MEGYNGLFDSDMYDTDDMEVGDKPKQPVGITTISKGMVTEIDINGNRFSVVNPEYVRELQKLMMDMSEKLRMADRNINTLNGNIRKMAQRINSLQSQLDGKVDRA